MRNKPLPGILWVAARPPVPPFSGVTGKTLCGITALSSLTKVEVVSFVEEGEREEVKDRFQRYWGERVTSSSWVAYGPRESMLQASLSRKFQFGTEMESSSLIELLDRLRRENPDRILIFDDITLSPFLARYGEHAIMSPHDCMSRMFASHLRHRPPGLEAARLLLQSRIARRYEREYYHLALLTHVITQRDRIWLEEINPRARYEVVPNADLLNPGFSPSRPNGWDLLVWGDLRVGSILRGTRAFLRELFPATSRPTEVRTLLVGRINEAEARERIGEDLLSKVSYAPFLEDQEGSVQHAKITVIPDDGGAGIKNRCVNILSSGKCLACLYPQMEGVERASDLVALNAVDHRGLVGKVKFALAEGVWEEIASRGQEIYAREYGVEANTQAWSDMVRRAVLLRDGRGG